MVEVVAHLQKNRLYVTLRGPVDLVEIKQASEQVIHFGQVLKPGFGVITDISNFAPAVEEIRQIIKETMQIMTEKGMGAVVRVIPSSSAMEISAHQWRRTSREIGYAAFEASSLSEAEALLDDRMAKLPD